MSGSASPAGEQRDALLVFPCNGNGIEALDCLQDSYRLLGFLDDTPAKQGSLVQGYRVHSRDALARWSQAQVLAVPGSPSSYRSRKDLIEGLGLPPERYARVIHPAASVSRAAVIGYNVLVMAGTVITSNAIIGDHVCILPNSVVHHDARVGSWSLVGSNVTIAGGVELGENCYVGSGTSIMSGLRVGAGALIGLGSTVIRDVQEGTTVAGSPARLIRG